MAAEWDWAFRFQIKAVSQKAKHWMANGTPAMSMVARRESQRAGAIVPPPWFGAVNTLARENVEVAPMVRTPLMFRMSHSKLKR